MIKNVERKNKLLAQLKDKEITMDEFLLACALWSLEIECWVDYEVRDYPMIPVEYQEYLNMPYQEKSKIKPEFFHQPNIKKYLNLKSEVYSKNWADYQWLIDCKKRVPDTEEYLSQHLKMDEMLVNFKNWFLGSSPTIEKARQVFGGCARQEVYNG